MSLCVCVCVCVQYTFEQEGLLKEVKVVSKAVDAIEARIEGISEELEGIEKVFENRITGTDVAVRYNSMLSVSEVYIPPPPPPLKGLSPVRAGPGGLPRAGQEESHVQRATDAERGKTRHTGG